MALALGNDGQHPNGMRVGGKSSKGMAAKVWEDRQFQNLDDSLQLEPETLSLRLRKLRKMTRKGENWEFDLDGTIKETAKNVVSGTELFKRKLNDINLIVFLMLEDQWIRL